MELVSRSLRVFDRVADAGSFTRVAQETYVSQPAVSKAIKTLEAELGVELFERDRHRGIALTETGERMLEVVRQMLDLEGRVYQLAYEAHGAAVDTVRVATIPFGTTEVLPRVLGAYREEFPNVHVELLEGDVSQVAVMVAEGQADLGITMAPYGRLDALALMRDEMVGLRAPGGAVDLVDLRASATQLVYCKIVQETLEACLPAPVVRDVARGMTVQSPEGVARLVASGSGVGLMSRYYAASMPGDLVVCPTEPTVVFEYGLVATSLDDLGAPARAFARHVVSACDPLAQA